MWTCIRCNTENAIDDPFCIECGTPKPKSDNHCSNPECKFYNVILANSAQKHCGKCGAKTTYWRKIEDMC